MYKDDILTSLDTKKHITVRKHLLEAQMKNQLGTVCELITTYKRLSKDITNI